VLEPLLELADVVPFGARPLELSAQATPNTPANANPSGLATWLDRCRIPKEVRPMHTILDPNLPGVNAGAALGASCEDGLRNAPALR
jgi:hypothetical protein